MPAPRTLFEKVWSRHVVTEGPGGQALLYVDRHLLHEGATHALERLAAAAHGRHHVGQVARPRLDAGLELHVVDGDEPEALREVAIAAMIEHDLRAA